MGTLLVENVYLVALMIFTFRVIDVSMGTLRTIATVHGRLFTSVVLGFFEILVWATSVSQLLAGVTSNPILLLAYAGGFACGNAAGILLERKLAWGSVIVQVYSVANGDRIADAFKEKGYRTTTYSGVSGEGPFNLVHVLLQKKSLKELLAIVRGFDTNAFYTIEPVSTWGSLNPIPHHNPTGWRAILKKK